MNHGLLVSIAKTFQTPPGTRPGFRSGIRNKSVPFASNGDPTPGLGSRERYQSQTRVGLPPAGSQARISQTASYGSPERCGECGRGSCL